MGETCTHSGHKHSDAAKRVSDAAMLAWTANGYDCVGKWLAFRLDDGSSDHTVYPRMEDAFRHNAWEYHFALALHPGGVGECEAEIMILFHRGAREKGFPQGNPDLTARARKQVLIPRIGRETIAAQISALLNRKRQ